MDFCTSETSKEWVLAVGGHTGEGVSPPDNLLSGSQVDGVKQCCLVRFEDNSEFWVLRKDIHSCEENFCAPECRSEDPHKCSLTSLSVSTSVAAGGEEVCCICDAPPLKEPLINCLKCRHGKESSS